MAEAIIDNYSIFVNVLTITLTIISLAITGGFFGVYQSLKHKLENEVKETARAEIGIEKARFFIGHGHMYWIDYKVSDSKEDVKISYLKQAIKETEKGLNLIKDSKEDKSEDYYKKELIKCFGMNNLAYYYHMLPIKERPLGTDKLAERYAEYVYDKITLFPEFRTSWTDTYNKVVLKQKD